MPKFSKGSKLRRFLFHNQNTTQTIAKNTFWLSFGEIFGRLLRVILIFYAARVLGAAGYGVFSYMTSLGAILTVFSDSGLSAILIREGATDEHQRRIYFATSFFIKLVVIAVSFLIVVFVAPKITNIPIPDALLYAVGTLIVFDALRVFGNAIFRAEERMQREAAANILTQLVILLSGFYILRVAPSPENLAMAYALGSAVGLIAVAYMVRSYIRGIFTFFRKELVSKIIIAGWPLGFSAIFGGLLVNMDTVMIGWFLNAEQVGYYSAAQKPIAFLYLLPAFIVGGLLPVMSRYAKTDLHKFTEVMQRGLLMTILLAYPLVVGIALNAESIITLVYGQDFVSAVPPMIVLSLTLLVTFPGSVIMYAIFAFDRHREMVTMWIVGTLLNALLNIGLIPLIGPVGAAISSLVTQLLVTGVFWQKMRKINHFELLRQASSIIKASSVLACATLLANFLQIPFSIIFPLSIVVYITSLVIFKDKTLKDIVSVFTAHDHQSQEA